LKNRERYPTTSALASLARADVLEAITALLARFKWRTVALLCDELSQFPGLNFYTGQCGDIRQMFTEGAFTWYNQPFDTANEQNFSKYLQATKNNCRSKYHRKFPNKIKEYPHP
jgi:hypothetical protein